MHAIPNTTKGRRWVFPGAYPAPESKPLPKSVAWPQDALPRLPCHEMPEAMNRLETAGKLPARYKLRPLGPNFSVVVPIQVLSNLAHFRS